MTLRCNTQILSCSVILLAVSIIANSRSYARTWRVTEDGGGDAPTIQAAVDSAAAGDSILVAAGKYFDTRQIPIDDGLEIVNVHLYKNVRIIGEGGAAKTMIKGYSSDIAVYIDGVDSTAQLSRFVIETSWSGYNCADTSGIDPWNMPAAVDARNSSALVAENLIRYNDVGIRLRASPATVRNNEIHHSVVSIHCGEESGTVVLDNELHDAMCLIECVGSPPTISGNDMRKACIAILSKAGADPLITNNLIHFIWSWGVVCRSGARIDGNHFIGNASAVYLAGDSGQAVVEYNLFFQNVFGVEITTSSLSQIDHNTFDACEFAVYCEGDVEASIGRNVIVRPGIGITAGAACSLHVECNNIFEATIAKYDGGCPDLTGINGNISVDPEFCGLAGTGNYYLQSDSPCVPGNHPQGKDCGQIGAFPVRCKSVPVADKSWGAIKRLFLK
jgi:hypothetical protein